MRLPLQSAKCSLQSGKTVTVRNLRSPFAARRGTIRKWAPTFNQVALAQRHVGEMHSGGRRSGAMARLSPSSLSRWHSTASASGDLPSSLAFPAPHSDFAIAFRAAEAFRVALTRGRSSSAGWRVCLTLLAVPLVFSYGTLQQSDVQLATFGRLLSGQRDELPAFEATLVTIEPAQVAAAGGKTHHASVSFTGNNESRVSGMAFEITDAELRAADEYEKRASYKRVAVKLSSGKDAWLYVDARSASRSS